MARRVFPRCEAIPDGRLVPVHRLFDDHRRSRSWDLWLSTDDRWALAAPFLTEPGSSLSRAPSGLVVVARPTPAWGCPEGFLPALLRP